MSHYVKHIYNKFNTFGQILILYILCFTSKFSKTITKYYLKYLLRWKKKSSLCVLIIELQINTLNTHFSIQLLKSNSNVNSLCIAPFC